MPSFPRLSRHNRSSNALAEPPAAPNAPAAAAGGGTGEAVSVGASAPGNGTNLNNQPSLHQQQHPQHQIPQGQPQPPPPQSQNQISADSPIHNVSAPHSALSSTQGFSSSDSSFADSRPPPPVIDPRREPHQQQPPGQQPPPVLQGGSGSGGAPLPPLPHQQQHQQVYGVSPDTSATDSPVFDGRRHPDFVEAAVNRSQSQRYSTYAALPHQQHLQQQQQQFRHQHAYSAGSASLEDLPSSAGYAQGQQPQAPQSQEKKSKRKFIKGIFSSSSRQTEQASPPPGQGFPEQNSYDNTSGLARRPSKRESNPPQQINTRLTKAPPPGHQQYSREWQQAQQQGQGSYSLEASPLHDVGEVDEYHYAGPEGDRDGRSLQSEQSQNNTIRQVSGEVESPTYDEQQQHLGRSSHQSHQGQNTGAYHAAAPHQQQLQAQAPHQQLEQPGQGAPLSEQQQPHVHLQHDQAQAQLEAQGQGQAPPPPQQLHQQHDQAHFQHQPRSSSLNQSQQFQYSTQPAAHQTPYQQVGEPRIVTTHLGAPPHQQQQQHLQQHQQQLPPQHHPREQNPETISQVSQESPATDPDQRSVGQPSAQASPAANYAAQLQDLAPTPNPSNPQLVSPQPVHPVMAPPPSGATSATRGDKRQGDQPPGYRHSNASVGALSIPPGAPGGPNPAFRGEATPRYESPGIDQGRHSPQPPGGEDEKASFDKLLTKYKNVKRLYFDGKSQIDNLTGQVEQLQNAVANQRIAASRTSLDDSEYSTRFNRLNGAINNLSFNIRKDWKDLPPWITSYVSADALKTGTKEMTAIGRAVIARWLVEELFEKCFHPGLDPHLSAQLKEVELSIRGNAYTMNSQEEFAALTAKVVTWRMATLDGLQKKLNSPSTEENRQALITKVTSNLTGWLYKHLADPPPAGVDGSTSMIIELAVGICANIPLESRDVAITYPLPGDMVRPEIMDVEKVELPALDADDSDSEDEKDKAKGRGDKPKSGMWTTMRSSRPPNSRKGSVVSTLGTPGTDTGPNSALAKDSSRVRFAGFMAWEVRGRQVLMKAPVWTI